MGCYQFRSHELHMLVFYLQVLNQDYFAYFTEMLWVEPIEMQFGYCRVGPRNHVLDVSRKMQVLGA